MARVLLIDDEELVRRIVRVVLVAEGHEVFEADDGTAGLAAVEREHPDVVVLDLMMPGVFGGDVCREIKAAYPTTRVIVLTSLEASQAKAQMLQLGADDFMEKPFSSLDLLDRLDRLTKLTEA